MIRTRATELVVPRPKTGRPLPVSKTTKKSAPEKTVTALKVVEQSQMSFNYDVLSAPVANEARQAAERIRLRLRRSAEDIIEIGRDLLGVKSDLGHGNFLGWIEAEFRMSDQTARNFMHVAEVYGDKIKTVLNLDARALYALAAPKTPIEVRAEVEKMIEAGEVVTAAKVKELRDKLTGLEKAKALAEEEIEQKDAKVSELEDGINLAVSQGIEKASKTIAKGYEDEISRLKREVADLKKPKPATTIDNDTGNIVQLGRHLTEEDSAEIDAETDEYTDANFIATADATARANAFLGAVRIIATVNAAPEAVYSLITHGCDQEHVDESLSMIGSALSQLETVKELHND